MDVRSKLIALWWADYIVKKRHKIIDTYPKQQKPPSDYWSESNCFMPKIGARCRAGKNCRCSAEQNTRMKGSIVMKDKGQVIEDLRIERRELEEKLEKLGKFMFSKDFAKCGSNQMRLLHEERTKIMGYIDVLTARINDLLGNPKE